MHEVVHRLGTVFWWLGTIWLAAIGTLGFAVLLHAVNKGDMEPAEGLVLALTCLLPTALCWAITYVCTGSYWRRPRLPAA